MPSVERLKLDVRYRVAVWRISILNEGERYLSGGIDAKRSLYVLCPRDLRKNVVHGLGADLVAPFAKSKCRGGLMTAQDGTSTTLSEHIPSLFSKSSPGYQVATDSLIQSGAVEPTAPVANRNDIWATVSKLDARGIAPATLWALPSA